MLKRWACLIFLALFRLGATDTANNTSPLVSSACQILSTQYPDQLYWPDSPSYANETTSYWSQSTILEPYCVFSPRNAQDVGQALSILRSTQTQFAVRGGGHMTVKGAASTNNGVLIALTQMRGISLSGSHQILSIGPGLTWLDVYNWIAPYGRAVVGARYAPVGVSGYLLGGGISFYSGQYGWGANNIRNFQVVTADSQIINANATSNPDLFWALKGGSSNYGIVTRFDLQTQPGPQVYAGVLSYDESATPQALGALESFVSTGGGIDDPASAILPNFFIDPPSGKLTASVIAFNNGNKTSSLRNFTAVPATASTIKLRGFSDFMAETVAPTGNRDYRDVFHATGLKASAESVRLINETVTRTAIATLKTIPGIQVSLSIQPISQSSLQAARASGGDAIDLDPGNGNFIAFNLYVRWSNASDDSAITQFAQQVLRELDRRSQSLGLYYPFAYLNDAGSGENVFLLYGGGKSLPRMRQIRQKYDPSGLFQYLQPGGFKLGV